MFCVYGLISLGRNFSPLPAPRKNHSLVTSGLYGEGGTRLVSRLAAACTAMAQRPDGPWPFCMLVCGFQALHASVAPVPAWSSISPFAPFPPGHIRHPIYGGLILAALGLSAITRSEGRLALSILLWVVVEQKAKAEEAALTARYGGDYRSYMDATKKFIPFLY